VSNSLVTDDVRTVPLGGISTGCTLKRVYSRCGNQGQPVLAVVSLIRVVAT
jgi:hypothetical protein